MIRVVANSDTDLELRLLGFPEKPAKPVRTGACVLGATSLEAMHLTPHKSPPTERRPVPLNLGAGILHSFWGLENGKEGLVRSISEQMRVPLILTFG